MRWLIMFCGFLLAGCQTADANIFMVEAVLPPKSSYSNGFGFSYTSFTEGEIGGFGSLKSSPLSREPHYDSLSPGSFGDPQTDRFLDFSLINGGLTYSPTSNVGMYVGLGYGFEQEVIEQFDPTKILSSDGFYYVDGESSSGVNFTLGMIVWLNAGLSFELGYDSYPQAITIGLGYKF